VLFFTFIIPIISVSVNIKGKAETIFFTLDKAEMWLSHLEE